MAAENDSDDKTHVGPPPQPKLPVGKPPAKPAADEHTQIGGAPPPPPRPLGSPPPAAAPAAPPRGSDEHTQIGAAPPPPPKVPAAPPSPPQPAAAPPPATSRPAAPPTAPPTAPAAPDADEGEATLLMPQRVTATVRLQRMQPAGRSETVALDRSSYLLGRSQTCDIRLFSPTASREHARLINRDGGWYIEPVEDRPVLANGATIKGATRLVHKTRIQLGGDELMFLDDSAPRQSSAAPAAGGRKTSLIAVIVGAIAVLAAAAVWWFMSR